MKVVYINLDRSRDRQAAFVARNAHLANLERFAAIDGAWADRQALEASGVIRQPLAYSDGAIGALLSHLSLWRRCIELDQPLTIAEDDAVFNRDFDETADRLMASAGDADMIFWGWNFDGGLAFEMLPGIAPCAVQFDEPALQRGIDAFPGLKLEPRLFKLLTVFGICCYTITPKGARQLFSRLMPIADATVHLPELKSQMRNFGIDVILNAVYREIDARVCVPPLAVTPNDRASSTIQE
jgi:glycosyl transferase family 25